MVSVAGVEATAHRHPRYPHQLVARTSGHPDRRVAVRWLVSHTGKEQSVTSSRIHLSMARWRRRPESMDGKRVESYASSS